jgi:hypothetical protein
MNISPSWSQVTNTQHCSFFVCYLIQYVIIFPMILCYHAFSLLFSEWRQALLSINTAPETLTTFPTDSIICQMLILPMGVQRCNLHTWDCLILCHVKVVKQVSSKSSTFICWLKIIMVMQKSHTNFHEKAKFVNGWQYKQKSMSFTLFILWIWWRK